jgi:hypothetical protein
LDRFGEPAEDSNPAASTQLLQRFPAIDLEDMLPRCQFDLTSGCKAHPEDLSTANQDAPGGASPGEAHPLVYRPQEWLLTGMHQFIQRDFESVVCPCHSRLWRLRHAYGLCRRPIALVVVTVNCFNSRIDIVARCHELKLLLLTDINRSTKSIAAEQPPPLSLAVVTTKKQLFVCRVAGAGRTLRLPQIPA